MTRRSGRGRPGSTGGRPAGLPGVSAPGPAGEPSRGEARHRDQQRHGEDGRQQHPRRAGPGQRCGVTAPTGRLPLSAAWERRNAAVGRGACIPWSSWFRRSCWLITEARIPPLAGVLRFPRRHRWSTSGPPRRRGVRDGDGRPLVEPPVAVVPGADADLTGVDRRWSCSPSARRPASPAGGRTMPSWFPDRAVTLSGANHSDSRISSGHGTSPARTTGLPVRERRASAPSARCRRRRGPRSAPDRAAVTPSTARSAGPARRPRGVRWPLRARPPPPPARCPRSRARAPAAPPPSRPRPSTKDGRGR
ncbi:hypothetical protein C8E97_3133 [Saccharothrix australiensis]|uniref:Uncharacterized protein n=1 Tax=Saccharothrix australiensis TaxID=2072 RepID=A0A495W035_9PSEU|nr:hypothetical protein C8E97_3133 [Saccharothrix australiensis]